MNDLDAAIARVVAADNCSGCGACLLLDAGLTLALDAAGFARPFRVGHSTAGAQEVARFRASCPGITVAAVHSEFARHPTMGTVAGAWEAWASDPELRRAGSSGGTLTALSAWLVETGRSSRVIGAAPASADARRTVSVSIVSREEALAAASSRYAPVTGSIGDGDPASAIVGPPCRSSAVRAAAQGLDEPLLLSFFCAGVPSQRATDALAERLDARVPTSLRYRGNGWPGRFAVERDDGSTATLSYEESWGNHLGRQVQWRCKICPDGVGEAADIVAADLWNADDRGFPTFVDGDGVSALIARTARGLDVVREAIAAGVIIASPLDIDRLASVQPLQVERRRTLIGRLAASALSRRPVPRYRGFGLVRLALPRWRETVRVARGTLRRLRAQP